MFKKDVMRKQKKTWKFWDTIFVILVSFQNDISESSMLKFLGESVHGFFGGWLWAMG